MNDMSVSAVEAILFAVAEPISVGKISEIMELSEEETKAILDQLGSELDARDAGICLLRFEDRYQLSTRPKYSDYVVRALDNRRNSPLSQAAMEVLAIIAYNHIATLQHSELLRSGRKDDVSSVNLHVITSGM